MPSRLSQQSAFAPISVSSTQSKYPASSPPQKKQKMSITQTYYLAHTARGKLSTQAARGDHDLRLLVGHANLLDSLMIELQDAEREQEAWFNQTVRTQSHKQESTGRVQWQDTIYEENVELPDASDSEEDSDSEYDEEETEDIPAIPLRRLRSPPAARPLYNDYENEDEDEEYQDEDFENGDLALTRTQSYVVDAEPELIHDSEDSDDESQSPPNSPPTGTIQFPAIIARDFADKKSQSSQPTRIHSTDLAPHDSSYFDESSSPSMVAVC